MVAREKSIDREEVMVAMEEAIQKAGRAKYGLDRDIRAMIDRKSGSITLERWIEVVEEVEDDATQMSVDEGAKQDTAACCLVNSGNSHYLRSSLGASPRRRQSR